jgi:hypothetical protein
MTHYTLLVWIDFEVPIYKCSQLLGNVSLILVMRFPFLLSGVEVESSSLSEVPHILVSFNIGSSSASVGEHHYKVKL